MENISFKHFTDGDLTSEMRRLAASERRLTVSVVACLAEFDRRRLYLREGFHSLFEYCVRRLTLTEHEAYNRMHAARAVRRHPALLDSLESGDLSLTAIRLLAPRFTDHNVQALISEARGRNTEGIKRLVAKLAPAPPTPSIIRKLPEAKPAMVGDALASAEPEVSLAELLKTAPVAEPASRRSVVSPLSESHYKLQVTIGASARERLTQIQDLMRHRLPSGDPAAIVERALEVLHAQLLKEKAAIVAQPRTGRAATEANGRYIPASVKREVYRRDRGACASDDGRRCGSTSGVEFHHVQPFSRAGEATVENLQMRCHAHNGFECDRHLDAETLTLVKG